jgi:hypothetical protein
MCLWFNDFLNIIAKCRTLCRLRNAFGESVPIEGWQYNEDRIRHIAESTTALQIRACTLHIIVVFSKSPFSGLAFFFYYSELSTFSKMNTLLSQFFAIALIGAHLICSTEAFPADIYTARPVPRALEITNAKNLREHIEVYGIPYGVLGAISHGLTFYVILCHFFGRRPLFPWMALEKECWNIAAVTISSLVSIILSGVTMARIRGSRPLLILAGMQIVLHALIDSIHIHRMLVGSPGWSNSTSIWAVPLLVVSFFSIYAFYEFPCKSRWTNSQTSETNAQFTVEDSDGRVGSLFGSAIFIVLIVWIGLTGFATLINIFVCIFSKFKKASPFAISAVLLSCGLFWFGDFGMAIVSRSTIGTPSDQVRVLYWTYWVVERIPLFTF